MWEANHVWLIFVLVVLWTGFPPVFAAVMSTLYIPLTLAAFGIIARGAAFAFRKTASSRGQRRLRRGFAFVLGAHAVLPRYRRRAAIASGRVPPGHRHGRRAASWWNPTSVLGGVLAVAVCAYLAAVYLCADARRLAGPELADGSAAGPWVPAVVVGAVAAGAGSRCCARTPRRCSTG